MRPFAFLDELALIVVPALVFCFSIDLVRELLEG